MTAPDYYDIVTPKPKEEGDDRPTRWLKIGAAFPQKEGRIDLVIDLIPVTGFPDRIFLFPKQKKDKPADYKKPLPRSMDKIGLEDDKMQPLGNDDIPF